jgi:hypothetical protein
MRRRWPVADILIIYSHVRWPPTATVRDSLYAFERHSGARCWYLHLGVRRIPAWLRRVPFDAVVFHPTVLWDRASPARLRRHMRRLRRLAGVGHHRVAMPQDEFLCSRSLVALIRELEIDHVFSVAPESEWDTIYQGVDRERVGISRVLTGYLAPETVERIDEIVRATADRPLAIGYRAARLLPCLGRHGRLKTEVAERVGNAAAARGLRTDIAIGGTGTIRGDDWYRFLASCRYTIGVEGGSSVHDPDGLLEAATLRYLAEHPGAPFEEVEASCFPGADGHLRYFAISPRHLEACATRTAQVLIEGSYNGILRAGEHYIELRRDFSNLDAVLDLIESDSERARLTENAYRDVVASGAYTYEQLVREVEAVALTDATHRPRSWRLNALSRWMAATDRAAWIKVAVWVRVSVRLRAFALRIFPGSVVAFIRRRVAGRAAEVAALQSAD